MGREQLWRSPSDGEYPFAKRHQVATLRQQGFCCTKNIKPRLKNPHINQGTNSCETGTGSCKLRGVFALSSPDLSYTCYHPLHTRLQDWHHSHPLCNALSVWILFLFFFLNMNVIIYYKFLRKGLQLLLQPNG